MAFSEVDKYIYPGERLWGRGSSDDKSGLIGILCALRNFAQNLSLIRRQLNCGSPARKEL